MNDTSETNLFLIEMSLKYGDEEKVARMAYDFIREAGDFDGVKVELVHGSSANKEKSLDPVIWGVLSATIAPTVLTKFLELLHDWSLRREGRVVRIKVQNKDGSLVEIEVPETTSPQAIQKYIELVRRSTKK